jgi:FkbM family methyltransferase
VKTWRELRRFPGLFSVRDASMLLSGVVLPMRFADRAAGRALAKEARIEREAEGVYKITHLESGLVFYWRGVVDNNLHYSMAQEFDPLFPHCYTTAPVQLTGESTVLDVGACEGLFAFRMIRSGQAGRVICFEPSARTAHYTRLGAEANGVADRVKVETMAVGRTTGRVPFVEGDFADGNRVASTPAAGDNTVDCIALDHYCETNGIRLGKRDLIKIDAEGFDFEVLLGAERIIRAGSPQIAVTTYHHHEHAYQIAEWLGQVQPAYKMRLKGFASWTKPPEPVLLQAAM